MPHNMLSHSTFSPELSCLQRSLLAIASSWLLITPNYALAQNASKLEAVIEQLPILHLLEPVWDSEIVHRESGILLKSDDSQPATLRLAFEADQILEVKSARGDLTFKEGSDFKLDDDRRTLTFSNPHSIAVVSSSELFPPKDSPNSYRYRVGHEDQNLLYAPGHWFHDRNIEVTYRRKQFLAGESSPLGTGSLPRTLSRLSKNRELRIAVSGDSISTGLDASGKTDTIPNQPGFVDLVAAQLQKTYSCRITVENRAVSGWSVANGVADLDSIIRFRPDLVIVAYGMNDVGRRDPKWFNEQTKFILDRLKSELPEADILLVSPMLGNKEWIHTPREMFPAYRDQLRELVTENVALADLSELWSKMLEHKHDLDLTGNGLNHPNDFGHRLYAQLILATIIGKPVTR